jgi:hypothetical protein
MSTDHSLGLHGMPLQPGDDAAGSLAVDPSSALGLGDSAVWPLTDQSLALDLGAPAGDGSDPDRGAASSMVVGADVPGTQLGGGDAVHLSKPIMLSFLPQPATADGDGSLGAAAMSFNGGDAILAAFAAGPWTGFAGDSRGAADAAGPASADLFSKGPSGSGGSHGGGGGAPAPTPMTNNNGLSFIIDWDSSVSNAPSGSTGFMAGFEKAVQYFLNNFSDAAHPTTITLKVGWGEVNGSRLGFGALGESVTNIDNVGFSTLQTALLSNLPAGDGPQSDPISTATTHSYWVPTAEEKALGLPNSNPSFDAAVGFSSSVKWNFTSPTTQSGLYDFVSAAEHEISEGMGRIGLGGATVTDGAVSYQNSYSAFDLFRFSDVSMPAPAGSSTAYFSYTNGGNNFTGAPTNLLGNTQTYFNTAIGGDISDWASSAGNDAYNAFSGTGTLATSDVDKAVMDVLGYGKVA